MTDTPDIDTVTSALEQLGAAMDAAECHGTLCGLICVMTKLEYNTWLDKAFPGINRAQTLSPEVAEPLSRLYERTQNQLNGPVCDFTLLLPADNQPLAQRTQALGDWCQGFLMGMSLGGIEDFSTLPSDAAEMARDLINVSRIEEHEIEESEADEVSLSEIIEYVRTGVLLINEEMHPGKAAPLENQTLH